MKEAYHYEKIDDLWVKCRLCPHQCKIKPDAVGKCRVRKNLEGKLYSMNYGKISGYSFDPIEKKPLYHFYPGREIFSFGTFGCNFSCDFCQNWQIAQGEPPTQTITVDEMVSVIKSQGENLGVAYTYNEPTIFYEFMYDTAKAVHEAGYKNVVVTNGFIMPEPLDKLLPYIDAMNIDLKAFNDGFYKNLCKGERIPVMETIKRAYGKAHIELTLLLIDGENSDMDELDEMFKWISEIDANIPVHISRYHPSHRMTIAQTKIETMKEARRVAKKYLRFVYLGNVLGVDNSTRCHNCGTAVIEREYFQSVSYLKGSKCSKCNAVLPIVND